MGYESKLYIVNRHDFRPSYDHVWGEIVATFDLSKMGYSNHEFYDAFTKEIDYEFYLPTCDDNGNEVMDFVNTDCYGTHMKSADLKTVIRALEICEERDHYRRLPPLIAMLKAFDESEWDELQVVHYGY